MRERCEGVTLLCLRKVAGGALSKPIHDCFLVYLTLFVFHYTFLVLFREASKLKRACCRFTRQEAIVHKSYLTKVSGVHCLWHQPRPRGRRLRERERCEGTTIIMSCGAHVNRFATDLSYFFLRLWCYFVRLRI